MYDANIMKKSSRFYLKYNPDNRWSFWTGKWWSLCSEISGQFTPKLGGQFDRLFHLTNDPFIYINIPKVIKYKSSLINQDVVIWFESLLLNHPFHFLPVGQNKSLVIICRRNYQIINFPLCFSYKYFSLSNPMPL